MNLGGWTTMSRRRGIWAGGLAIALACASARGADEPKVSTAEDLVYTKVGDRELKLDMARPGEGDGPFPAVVCIHGGAWRAGNKRDVHGACIDLARRGYVAISPQYRFCPKETFPAQVHDVKAAVRWLRAHASEYKVDPDRIGAMGFSAGGHLSLMLGVTGPEDGLEGDVTAGAPSSKVQAVVNYFGPTDLAAKDFPDVSKGLLRDFVGGTPAEKPEPTAKASPVTFLTKDDAPILTFQGTKDPLVPHSQATRLGDAMTAAGVAGRVELMLGAGHGWGGAEMEHTRKETLDFFDRYLKKPQR
jgi:acetyl esterase/lipase